MILSKAMLKRDVKVKLELYGVVYYLEVVIVDKNKKDKDRDRAEVVIYPDGRKKITREDEGVKGKIDLNEAIKWAKRNIQEYEKRKEARRIDVNRILRDKLLRR